MIHWLTVMNLHIKENMACLKSDHNTFSTHFGFDVSILYIILSVNIYIIVMKQRTGEKW